MPEEPLTRRGEIKLQIRPAYGSACMRRPNYPDAVDPDLVGTYPALSNRGGGYVWDDVLEYRVWYRPQNASERTKVRSDCYRAFARYSDALAFSARTTGSEHPLALVLQREHIAEPEPGQFLHVRKSRITEWPVRFLAQPRRNSKTIPIFLRISMNAHLAAILRILNEI